MLALDAQRLGVEDQDAFDQIAQLANVARPMVLLEGGEGVVGHINVGATVLRAKLLEEFLDEKRDVFLAVAQWRNEKRDDVQAIEEIFAKVAASDLFLKILVGGSDDANVDVDGV